MSQIQALTLVQEALLLALKLSAPAMMAGLSVGILVSVFQAATQIHEQTLVFVPKVLTVLGVLIACGGWMMVTIVDFSQRTISSISTAVR